MSEPLVLIYNIVCPHDASERQRRFRYIVDHGVKAEDLVHEDAVRLFNFISSYVDRYKIPPTVSVLEVETGFRFSEGLEIDSFDHCFDLFKRFRQKALLSDCIYSLSDILRRSAFTDVPDVFALFNTEWTRLHRRRHVVPLVQAISDAIEEHDTKQRSLVVSGIQLGFPYIDAVTGGVQPGDIALIVGASGSGKTYILCRSAEHAAALGKRILFVSMEMTSVQIGRRISALGAHIDGTALRLGYLSRFAMQNLLKFVDELRKRDQDHFMIVEGSMSIRISDLKLLVREFRPDAVFIDGVYMLKPSNSGYSKQRWESLLEAIEELKNLAVDEKVALIGSMQFRRKGAKEGLEGIGYSYAVAQAASLAFGLRDLEERENLLTIDDPKFNQDVYKILEIIKGREGEAGRVLLRYDMRRAFIEETSILSDENRFSEKSDFDSEL